jgi:CubicO group peptidase (beta-lactamase class C family)
MGILRVDTDPAELGLDPERLARIDRRLARFVDEGRLPGWQTIVTRHGEVVHASRYGHRDVAADLPVEDDTLFRIYSMTKPITSVAAMMLWEQGELGLDDPIATWLPEFASPRVYRAGTDLAPATVPAIRPITVRHLLTHTSGLTYSFHRIHPVDAMYRKAKLDEFGDQGVTLADMSRSWADQPLVFQPGDEWLYSVATDVLGRLIEVVSGQPLADFFAEHILGPLGMHDTMFVVDGERAPRLAQLYQATADGFATVGAVAKAAVSERWTSGGGGLSSTAYDYHRFTQLLLRGGELDGVRLLSPGTIARMRSNHLPGNVDIEAFGRPIYAETPMRGVGFGLGFSTTIDVAASAMAASTGDYGWGGMAGTAFTVDPELDLTILFFTQVIPPSALPIRQLLRQLVHAAVVD